MSARARPDVTRVPAGIHTTTPSARLSVAGCLSARPGIGLEELNAAAALQTRTDRKYVLSEPQAFDILTTFTAPVRVLEEDGRRAFTYASVYFDTAALDSYLLTAHGRRRRYKIRTRTYVDSGTTFLEVKTEGARAATVKERMPCPAAASRHLDPAGLAYVREALADSIGSVPTGPLQPVLETLYRRLTLYLPDSGSRATIDIDVTWRDPGGRSLRLDRAVILETKSAGGAGTLDRHLWAHGIRPSRISKFATGMAALNPALPANRWHRTLIRMLPLTQP